MKYSFFLSPVGLQIMIQKASFKKKKKRAWLYTCSCRNTGIRNVQRELSFLYKGVDAKNHKVFPLKTIQKARVRNILQGNKYKYSLSLRTGLARDSPGQICSQGYFPPFPTYTFPTDVLFSPATSSLIHLSTPSCAQFRSEMQIT